MSSSSFRWVHALLIVAFGVMWAKYFSLSIAGINVAWMFSRWLGTEKHQSLHAQSRRIVAFRNLATLAADLYLDDGLLGYRLGVLKVEGEPLHVNARVGDRFFFTINASPERFIEPDGSLVEVAIEPDTYELVLPHTSEAQGRRCLDRYKLCENQSALGLCHKQPGWMISNCCVACNTALNSSHLLDPEIRCQRKFLNTTYSRAWSVGDVDVMFSNIINRSAWYDYTSRVLSSPPEKPWVVLLEDFISSEESSALIEGGISEGFTSSSIHKEKHHAVNALGELASITDSSRTSSTAWCSKAKCGAQPLVRQIVEKIQNVTGVRRANFEPLQILSYAAGQYCKSHLDSKKWLASTAAGHRILTVLLFLQSPELGGETAFEKLGLKVAPEAGAALIWSNVLNEDPDELDVRVFHEGLAVQEGTKIVANAWAHMYDVEFAEKWGC